MHFPLRMRHEEMRLKRHSHSMVVCPTIYNSKIVANICLIQIGFTYFRFGKRQLHCLVLVVIRIYLLTFGFMFACVVGTSPCSTNLHCTIYVDDDPSFPLHIPFPCGIELLSELYVAFEYVSAFDSCFQLCCQRITVIM